MKNMKKCLALLLALLLALSLAACGGDSSPQSMNRPPPSRICQGFLYRRRLQRLFGHLDERRLRRAYRGAQ